MKTKTLRRSALVILGIAVSIGLVDLWTYPGLTANTRETATALGLGVCAYFAFLTSIFTKES